MRTQTLQRHTDLLGPDEALDPQVEEVCVLLEAQGWRVASRTGRGFRYWCPCSGPRTHNVWVDTLPQPRVLVEISRRTCFVYEGGDDVLPDQG